MTADPETLCNLSDLAEQVGRLEDDVHALAARLEAREDARALAVAKAQARSTTAILKALGDLHGAIEALDGIGDGSMAVASPGARAAWQAFLDSDYTMKGEARP